MADIEKNEAEKKTEAKAAPKKADKPKLSVRIGNMWRAYKSEFKKISWANKDDVVKNTTLVLVATVVVSAFIVLCDNVFFTAISALGGLISL